MVSVDLGACEWFVWDLRRSNLIERGQLEQLVGEFLESNPKAEPPILADFLVRREILTRFQADSLLAGKNQGLVLGPYILQDALGAGSMGTVYKARSKTRANQSFAVKVLPRRSMWNIRLARRKVREFEQFQHPAVVPFVDVGTAGGMHYLAWPLVGGEPLDQLVAREGKLPPSLAANLALQTAEGLEACHTRSIIHGLIKPSNLLIDQGRQVRILDFGVGALLAETEGESVVDTMSTANTMASGLDCASPESIMDPTASSAASDQYSLGCVLYFCLTGAYPFAGGSAVEKMMAHQTKQPAPIADAAPQTPAELIHIVEKLMAKVPAQRFASISDAVSALKPLAREASSVPSGRFTKYQSPVAEEQHSVPSTAPLAKPVEYPPSRIAPAQIQTKPSSPATLPPSSKRPITPQDLPDRRSIRGRPVIVSNPQTMNVATPAAPTETAPQPADTPIPKLRATNPAPRLESDTWEDRIGPGGIVLLALASCAAAWLMMWLLNR